MTYTTAKTLLNLQERNISKINGTRLEHKGFEYKVTYMGGFGAYIAIDRRQIGKRNFKYFGGVSGAHCLTLNDALQLVENEIEAKG